MGNAILTGYKGFIGKNLFQELQKKYELYLIEKDDIINISNEKLESLVKDSEIIFHNGAIADTSLQDYKEMLFYNYFFSKKLIDLAKKYKKRIIFAGSASVYGNGEYPQNIYAWSKMITEEYGRAHYPDGFISLRYFNVYGPGEEEKGKMASIAYQAWKHSVEMNNDDTFKLFPKKPTRDFVYVKDVVFANLSAITCPPNIYDVGSGESCLFETFLEIMNIPYEYSSVENIPSWYQYFTKANTGNFIPEWKPKYNLESGMKEYLIYLKKNKK